MIKKLNSTFSSKFLHFPSLKIDTSKTDLSRNGNNNKSSVSNSVNTNTGTNSNNNNSGNENNASVKNSHSKNDIAKECDRYFLSNNSIEPDFEYRGYHKFGRVLGKGRFGTVIECVRKSDDKPIALKFFKNNAIHQWIPENFVVEHLDAEIKERSEFFSKQEPDRLLPSEVACLVRASKQSGIVQILDYLPTSDDVYLNSSESDSDEPDHRSNSSPKKQLKEKDDESIIGIVLERNINEVCLFDYLFQNDCLGEDEARIIMKQIVEISLNLLNLGILHGDLKSENILIDPQTKAIRIIDFGSAQLLNISSNDANHHNNHHHHNHHHHHSHHSNHTHHSSINHHHHVSQHSNGMPVTKCNGMPVTTCNKPVRIFRGTNLYKPPEYLLHHCFYPRPSTVWTFGIILYDMVTSNFPFENDNEVMLHQEKELIFKRKDLSDNLKDLLKRCLAFFVADRIVIEKILTHPWMNAQSTTPAQHSSH